MLIMAEKIIAEAKNEMIAPPDIFLPFCGILPPLGLV